MAKVLWFRFQQCLSPFPMLHVEGSSESRLFRHLSNHVFLSPSAQKYISCERHFFWKCSKLTLNLENVKKNSEKIFPFLDQCIWKSCNQFPLLRRECLSSGVNGLTNSPQTLHISHRNFCDPNILHRDQ